MNDIISKLNTLKSVQPSEKLVVEMREEVLSKAPVFCGLEHNYNKKSIFDLSLNNFFASKLAVSFATVIFVLFGGFSASYASKSSLPGDTLYHVKIASENVVLAVASGDKKAEIEIEQAGKRLEELAEISKKPSDINQGEKLKQLVTSFEEKINKAQDGLTKIEDNGKKAKIAKVINVQTEKYTEVLAVTKENLTDVVKNDVSERFASATDSNKKVNLDSLAVWIDVMTDEDKDEITAIVKDKVEKEAELKEEETSSGGSVSETDQSVTEEEAPGDISDNTDDTEEDGETEQDSDISEDTADIVETEYCSVPTTTTIEEEKEVLINLLDNLNSDPDDGEVKGDADKEETTTTEEETAPGAEKTTTEDEEIISDEKLTPVGI